MGDYKKKDFAAMANAGIMGILKLAGAVKTIEPSRVRKMRKKALLYKKLTIDVAILSLDF